MIAANDDRRLETPLAHQLVEPQPEARAFAVAEPQDPRRQPLEGNARPRQLDPARQRFVVPKQFQCGLVRDADVLRVAGQRRPSERTLAFAKQRPDVFRHEARNVERFGHAGLPRLGAEVIAVVERHRTTRSQHEHGAHVCGDGCHRSRDVVRRVAFAQPRGFIEAHPVRDVAVQRVVRGRLVRQHIRRHPASHQRGQHVGGVAA